LAIVANLNILKLI